jgi:2-deoxy-D-gluconate 3-dehydrogenase
MQHLFDLKNKRAIVTGGASGLGRAMAEALYDANAELCIIDVSDNIEQIAKEITKNNRKVNFVKANLLKREEVKSAFEKALGILGGVDILVNSAGTQRRHKSEEFPIEDWDVVIELNLTTVFMMCQLAGKEMIKQGHGKIINIASMLSFMGGFTVPAYAASKGGVAQLTKTLTNEWGPKGINVNAIAPGWMDTPLTAALVGNPEREPAILARTPASRWGKPEDLKGTAVFLASAASDFINGAIIPVDGGYLAK